MSLPFSVWGSYQFNSESREDSIQTLSVLIPLLFCVVFQYGGKYTGVCMLRGCSGWMGMPQSAKILSVRPGPSPNHPHIISPSSYTPILYGGALCAKKSLICCRP